MIKSVRLLVPAIREDVDPEITAAVLQLSHVRKSLGSESAYSKLGQVQT